MSRRSSARFFVLRRKKIDSSSIFRPGTHAEKKAPTEIVKNNLMYEAFFRRTSVAFDRVTTSVSVRAAVAPLELMPDARSCPRGHHCPSSRNLARDRLPIRILCSLAFFVRPIARARLPERERY